MFITAMRVTVRMGLKRRDVRGDKGGVGRCGGFRLPTETERQGECVDVKLLLVEVIERPDMLLEGGRRC